MKDFSRLIDAIAFAPGRNAKLTLIADYMRATPDPDRGYALAVLTGTLDLPHAKPKVIRDLIAERCDPVLFDLSYDYVGDLSETVALLWPSPPRGANALPPLLSEIVDRLAAAHRAEMPGLIAHWLDLLDETGRWALIKLMTGSLRIGVSARLAKTALTQMGARRIEDIEEVWHGLAPPYTELFAWLEGRRDDLVIDDPAPFRAPMLAHPLDEAALATFDPADYLAEWKWDGIRIQAVAGRGRDGPRVLRLYSRTGEDITHAFPDLVGALDVPAAAIDGELLIRAGGLIQPFGALQQRLNRKSVTPKLMKEFPAHLRAYDLLVDGDEDLRARPFAERRARLEALVARHGNDRFDLSPLTPFADAAQLAAARADPTTVGAGPDANAIEGVMLKRRDSAYVAGRVTGLWWKWKRDPFNVDAVLMYAQRGHGKRSSYYSDYTFGVWKGDDLVPVGKAYFGFTDEELLKIDRFVRNHTTNRFGPVREVAHEKTHGLVFEVAFEGLNKSARNKSGLAMRFPRIARIRWDKPPHEAGTLDELAMLLDAPRNVVGRGV